MRTIIVEDWALFRGLLAKACATEFGCAIVGEAPDGLAGKALVESLRPELLITDINMPGCTGIELARYCRTVSPATKILMTSSYSGDYTLSTIDPALIDGFVDKNTGLIAKFGCAIEAIRAGRRYFCPESVEGKLGVRINVDDTRLLTEREQAILSLIGDGLSDAEIAAKLGISAKTSETHRTRIMRKLRIAGSAKLSVFAVRNGLAIPPGDGKSECR
jgi:DNA-binding NarL/FixJ family response regulator